MDIVGKVILALPEQSGVSKSGNQWKKREYVLETQENYPRRVFFTFFGNRADENILNVGQMVRLYFDIESREYNGRWYTEIRGWKTEDPNAAAAAQPQAAAYGMPAPAPYPGAPAPYPTQAAAPGAVPPPPVPAPEAPDDLPF